MVINQASDYFERGQMQMAMMTFYQALSIALVHFGDNHPDTMDTRRNIETIRDSWLGN